MNRRTFLKSATAIFGAALVAPIAGAFPIPSSSIKWAQEFFDYDRDLGIAGRVGSFETMKRSAVMIRGYALMDSETQKQSISVAKEMVARQLSANVSCVYGDDVLVGNEVNLPS